MRRVFLFSLLLLFFSCGTKSEKIRLAKEDLNLVLTDLAGNHTNLADAYGEVIFLNYWASWCPPCRAEMPSVQQLYHHYKDQIKFVFISLEEPAEDSKNYLEQGGFSFPSHQVESVIPTKIKPASLPTTLIISKNGTVELKKGGARDWNQKDVYELLDSLIQKK